MYRVRVARQSRIAHAARLGQFSTVNNAHEESVMLRKLAVILLEEEFVRPGTHVGTYDEVEDQEPRRETR